MRTLCSGFSSGLQALSPCEQPIMNSPVGIFTNSIPIAFFSVAVDWALEGTCKTRQVTAMANVATRPNLICLFLRCVDVEHVSNPVSLSTEYGNAGPPEYPTRQQ